MSDDTETLEPDSPPSCRVRLNGFFVGVCTQPEDDTIARMMLHGPALRRALPAVVGRAATLNAAHHLADFELIDPHHDDVLRSACRIQHVKLSVSLDDNKTFLLEGVRLAPIPA